MMSFAQSLPVLSPLAAMMGPTNVSTSPDKDTAPPSASPAAGPAGAEVGATTGAALAWKSVMRQTAAGDNKRRPALRTTVNELLTTSNA